MALFKQDLSIFFFLGGGGGYSKQSERARVSPPRSSANEVQPNLSWLVLIFNALHCIRFHKTGYTGFDFYPHSIIPIT